jgi:hypothetical protein
VKGIISVLLVGLGVGMSGALVATIIQEVGRGPERYSDFLTYYTAATLLERGISPYDEAAQREARRQLVGAVPAESNAVLLYFLPPPLLLMVLPLTCFSPRTANALWIGAQVVIVWPCCLLLLRRYASRRAWLLTAAWSLPWFPMLVCLKFGQLSVALLLAFLGLHHALVKKHNVVGGLWLALLTIKPPLLVLPLLLAAYLRRWKMLAAALLVVTAAYVVVLTMFGTQLLPEYVSSVAAASRIQTTAQFWRTSTYSVAGLADRSGVVRWPVLGVLDLAVLAVWMRILGRRGLFSASFCMPTASILISPHVFVYDLVVCLSAVPLLAGMPPGVGLVLAILGFVLPVVTHLVVSDPFLMVAWMLCLLAAVLLVPAVGPQQPPTTSQPERGRGSQVPLRP